MGLRESVLAASRQAHSENPSRLEINSSVECFRHSTRVIQILQEQGLGAAYIGKTNGEGQYRPIKGFPRQIGPYAITGVSHDAIWVDGRQFDLIGGGNDGPEPLGTPGVPTANEIPPEFYRANNPPVPYPLTIEEPRPEPPKPVYPPYPQDESVVDGAGHALFADFAEAGQSPNALMFRFAFRVAYSWLTKEVPDLPASEKKHRSEWRALLGLPPK